MLNRNDWPGRYRVKTRLTSLSWLILTAIVIVIVISWLIIHEVHQRIYEESAAALDVDANNTAGAINSQVQSYDNLLNSFKGFLLAAPTLPTQSEFSAYYNSVSRGSNAQPGEVSFISNVPNSDGSNLAVSLYGTGKLKDTDLANASKIVTTLDQARLSGLILSSKTLPNSNGFILVLPVYKGGTVPTAENQRISQFLGFLNIYISYSELFNGVFDNAGSSDLTYTVYDTGSGMAVPIYRQQGASIASTKQLNVTVAMPVAGRYWKLGISSPVNFAQTQADQGMISSAIVFGIAIAVLLAIILYFQTQNRREQLLEQSKDEFVSLASHQLRAPLTSIHLFVEMMLDEQVGKLTDKQREYLNNVSTSTGRLTDLVTEFLNISALELGQLNVKTQYLNLEDTVDSSIKQFSPAIEEKNLTVSFNKPALPKVAIDPNLYAQIVNNLISNAINYSSRNGLIEIYLHKEQTGFQLDVKDDGIGITADAKDKVFERFYRADNAKRETSNGTGLGLYLVKLIVDMCHGKTWYESTEGQGSTFHVIIPLSGMSSIAKHKMFEKTHGRKSE